MADPRIGLRRRPTFAEMEAKATATWRDEQNFRILMQKKVEYFDNETKIKRKNIARQKRIWRIRIWPSPSFES